MTIYVKQTKKSCVEMKHHIIRICWDVFAPFFTLAFYIFDTSQTLSWNMSITQIINWNLCFCGLFGEAPIFPSIFSLILKKWLHFQVKNFYVDHNVELSLEKNIMLTLYWSTFIISVHKLNSKYNDVSWFIIYIHCIF